MTAYWARERVRHGAALLDAKCPGWAARVDVIRLNIGSCRDCILGQVYGGFGRGCDELGVSGVGHATGFLAPLWELAELKTAWCDAIAERLTPPASWTHREAVGEAKEMVGV